MFDPTRVALRLDAFNFFDDLVDVRFLLRMLPERRKPLGLSSPQLMPRGDGVQVGRVEVREVDLHRLANLDGDDGVVAERYRGSLWTGLHPRGMVRVVTRARSLQLLLPPRLLQLCEVVQIFVQGFGFREGVPRHAFTHRGVVGKRRQVFIRSVAVRVVRFGLGRSKLQARRELNVEG